MAIHNKLFNYIINFLFLILPLSIILGNFAINLNVILLIIFTLIFCGKKIKKIQLNLIDKIILFFFFYILLVFLLNFIETNLINKKEFSEIIINKTFYYFRYLFFYFSLRILCEQKILNFNLFNLICSLTVILISIDIFIQFFLGKNIIGFMPISNRHFSGMFGEELIAGSYVQKFSLFAIFSIFFYEIKFYQKNLIQIILFTIFLIAIVLSGNRMPLIMFVLTFLFYFTFIKFYRKELNKFLIFTIFLFLVLSFSNKMFKENMRSFFFHGYNLITTIANIDLDKEEDIKVFKRPYVSEFYCSKLFIQKNPIIGGGVRSYRSHYGGCSTHPHNYYLELLVDLGIIGTIIIIFLVILVLKKSFFQLNYTLDKINIKIIPFFLIFFSEMFPLKTSGSFFSTSNATIIFLTFSILASYLSKKEGFGT